MNKAYLIETQCRLIYDLIRRWYGDGYPDYSPVLRQAIEQTVNAGLFNEADVHYSLRAHYEAIELPNLRQWVDRSIPESKAAEGQPSVLCLHAGNFPLAGLQNALGVLLSGAGYWGKLSSSDPYLLDSLLRLAADSKLQNLNAWSVELESLQPAGPFDAVLFAGEEASVAPVRAELQRQKKTKVNTQFLVRTTHYSVAFLYEITDEVLDRLTEAMLRYEGLGCRSVAIVVTPYKLDRYGNELERRLKGFLKKVAPVHIDGNYVTYQMAYNEARGVNQLFVPPFLIQEAEDATVREGVVFWIQGDARRLEQLLLERQNEVQTVYSDKPEVLSGELNTEQAIEPISHAQSPPIDWRADGVDTIEWIWDNLVP